MVPVECIARGYLAGLGLESYKATGEIAACRPTGPVRGLAPPEPVFTPTTKAPQGHDEFLTFEDVADSIGPDAAAEIKRLTLDVYARGAEIAGERGSSSRTPSSSSAWTPAAR